MKVEELELGDVYVLATAWSDIRGGPSISKGTPVVYLGQSSDLRKVGSEFVDVETMDGVGSIVFETRASNLFPDPYRRGTAIRALDNLANQLQSYDVQKYAAEYARYLNLCEEGRRSGIYDIPSLPQPPTLLLENPELLILVQQLVRQS